MEREREIRALPQWNIGNPTAIPTVSKPNKRTIRLEAVKKSGQTLEPKKEHRPMRVVALLERSDFIVADREEKTYGQNRLHLYHLNFAANRKYLSPWFSKKKP